MPAEARIVGEVIYHYQNLMQFPFIPVFHKVRHLVLSSNDIL